MSSYGLPAVLREFEIKNVEMTDRSIDVGVFGTSYEGSWIGAPCAVKKLHTSDAKDGYISDRFVYECKIWCELKHPNIIQFFGICVSPKENCPMLVCELQRDNLSRFLSNKTRESVPLSIKASILKDVALAMRYLHSLDPIVLYRDLNASYIYLTANLTAKLGDFGSASKLDLGKKATLPPTGKTDFPEPYCSVSADSFTYGELILHILIHEFPKPSPKVVDGHSDKTMVLKEFDRRKAYTSTLNSQEKQFLPLIARCLQDNPDNRPNFNEILDIVDTYLCVLDSEASKNVKATKLLHLMSELGYKEKELHSVKAELARLRMSLTSIVMGGEGESHRQSLPLKLRGPPPEPPPRLDKARSLKSRFSTSPPKVAKKPPTTSMETLVDQGYVSVTPSVRGSLISTADTSEDDYLEMNKPSSSPEVPKALSPGLTSPLHNSKQLPSSRTSPKVGPPPTRSSMSSLDTDDDYSSVKTREAVVKKDYKTLKYADRVQVLKWMPESCLVQNERTGRPEYIPPEYLAELKPIENEM
jgi:serine/threonine protein kinase